MADKIDLGGVTNTSLYRESDGTLIVEEKQDCEAILDHNQRGRDHRFSAASPSGEFYEVANIPMVPFLEECRKAGVGPLSNEAQFVMQRMLNDPKYARFLSAPKVRDPRIILKGVR